MSLGSAEQFYTNASSGVAKSVNYQNKNSYNEFDNAGYDVINNSTRVQAAPRGNKTLGILSISNMDIWLDHNYVSLLE